MIVINRVRISDGHKSTVEIPPLDFDTISDAYYEYKRASALTVQERKALDAFFAADGKALYKNSTEKRLALILGLRKLFNNYSKLLGSRFHWLRSWISEQGAGATFFMKVSKV